MKNIALAITFLSCIAAGIIVDNAENLDFPIFTAAREILHPSRK